MTLGEYVKMRRRGLRMSRSEVARKAGVSNTEILRIETGERRNPSIKNLCAIAEALNTAREELLKLAGYEPEDDTSVIERTFPGLKTEKQQRLLENIADSIARNPSLGEEELDGLYRQMEMYIYYVKNRV